VKSDGTPFFYLADTAWELFIDTTRADADLYLTKRAEQGFTVVQATVYGSLGPSRYGQSPFVNGDPTRPNESYFQHVDYVINEANALGMYVALVPLDSHWAKQGHYNDYSAYVLGRYLGARYANAKIIWTLGGDINVDQVPGGVELWANLASGIARGAAGKDMSRVLLQYHPEAGKSSTLWFQNRSWLDVNGLQSGHGMNPGNYNTIAADYGKSPAKPVMDFEVDYEGIPAGIVQGATRLTDYDVRKSAYWSVFAGAHGVTYGNNNVWQFVTSPNSRNLGTTSWKNSLDTAGAWSMANLKRLMLSRPYLNRVPDQSLIVGSQMSGTDRLQATRGGDNSYAFIYTSSGKPVTVNLNKLSGSAIDVRWFNPRNPKKTIFVGTIAKSGNRTFTPPSSGAGNDWVLVLDDSAKRYGKP
jgi:hypothetical protein